MTEKRPKAPLPLGVSSTPRTNTRKRKDRDKNSEIMDALNALTSAELTRQNYEQYLKEAYAETNDRGAAIIIATNLENVLQLALERRLQSGRNRRDLFGNNSPLGTFDFKIRIGEAIRIFGTQTSKNLNIIRIIRNTFAHSKIPIGFSEPAIHNACALLQIPKLLPPVSRPTGWIPETQEALDSIQGRQRFTRVCDDIAHNLLILSLTPPSKLEVESIETEGGSISVKHRDVWVLQKPLP